MPRVFLPIRCIHCNAQGLEVHPTQGMHPFVHLFCPACRATSSCGFQSYVVENYKRLRAAIDKDMGTERPDSLPRLSEKEMEALRAAWELMQEKGHPPTMEEIGQRCGGRGFRQVHRSILACERKGWLARTGARKNSAWVFKRVPEKAE